MSRGPDAHTLLERALIRAGDVAGCPVTASEGSWERWASATFVGARHHLTLRLGRTDAAKAWLAELADAELPIRGHLLADLLVTGVIHDAEQIVARIEALTVEDR